MFELSAISLSSGHLFGLPLIEIWFVLVFFLLAMFLFLDGFDFGVGALFATRNDETEKHMLFSAVGPFWDGNEVWLVVFGGALFAVFPSVYAGLFSRYYLLMFALLFALALRGAAPEFHEQADDDRWRRVWEWAFVIGSVSAPFFLGVFIGNWLVGAPGIVTIPGIIVGLLVVSLTVVEGVAYLALKLPDDVRSEIHSYALPAIGVHLLFIIATLGWIIGFVSPLRTRLLTTVGIGIVLLVLVCAVLFVIATRRQRDRVRFVAAAGLAFTLVALVAYLLHPTIDPATGMTVRQAIVPTVSLNVMSIMAAIMLPLILGYFIFLYSVFSGSVSDDTRY
ncbi:cytochrome d ubiquinol oxidase subunit II [halophilic archaeon]|nr:cytochrome d ubiquinol oxidase subunit II [halophilic archaeon]